MHRHCAVAAGIIQPAPAKVSGSVIAGAIILGAIGLVLAIVMALARGASGPVGAPSMTVSAERLAEDFKANEVRAEAKYRGQTLRVYGPVSDVSIVFGSPIVTLGSGFPKVTCNLAQRDAAAAINRGQTITVVGRCGGQGFNVQLHDCEIR